MALIRKVQGRGGARYVAIPRVLCDHMSIVSGQHMLIHSINSRQVVYTKVDEDLPVIQLEEDGMADYAA